MHASFIAKQTRAKSSDAIRSYGSICTLRHQSLRLKNELTIFLGLLKICGCDERYYVIHQNVSHIIPYIKLVIVITETASNVKKSPSPSIGFCKTQRLMISMHCSRHDQPEVLKNHFVYNALLVDQPLELDSTFCRNEFSKGAGV